MALLAENCLAANSWICGRYVTTRSDDILSALRQHVTLTAEAVLVSLLLSLPLALLVRRSARLSALLLGISTAIYTVPSLALLGLLVPQTGLSRSTVVIMLVLYSLTVLLRNVLAGLEAVPDEVTEAARGMGMGSVRMLLQVELPLALPAVFAGLRVATVSTVALVTIGALIGYGGLGNLIYDGLNNFFKAEVLTASVLCVALAVVLDLTLVLAERLLTPWTRARPS